MNMKLFGVIMCTLVLLTGSLEEIKEDTDD